MPAEDAALRIAAFGFDFDSEENQRREDYIVQQMLATGDPVSILVMGAAHDLADNVPAGVEYAVLQRDMGVAVLTLLIGATYLLFVRIPARAWAVVAGMAAATLAGLWKFVFQEYQRASWAGFPRVFSTSRAVEIPGTSPL